MEENQDCFVRMKDGVLTLCRVVPEKRVSLNALVQTMMSLDKKAYSCTPVLPGSDGACRVFAENDKAIGFLMQCNPTMRTIHFAQRKQGVSRDYRKDPEYTGRGQGFLFDVSMPWIWVFCKFYKVDEKTYDWRRCFLCATYKNIETLDDDIYVAPLPNQWGTSCLMCTGNIIQEGDKTDKPALVCRKFMFKLFSSFLNDDLSPAMPSMIDSGGLLVDTLWKWESLSKDNPGIALNQDFGMKRSRHDNLGDFIGNAMGGKYDDARG